MAHRYTQLLNVIDAVKPESMVEVGTWNGDRATAMIMRALQHRDFVTYDGYDLFSGASVASDARESNVKRHVPLAEVVAKLEGLHRLIATQHPAKDFVHSLQPGDTRITLHPYPVARVDLAYIDGGHSLETIWGDFWALAAAPVLVLDDYYTNDESGRGIDILKFGCNDLVRYLINAGAARSVEILPVKDPVRGGGWVQFVRVENVNPAARTNRLRQAGAA